MKKLALTIAIVFGISLFTYAQTEKAGGLFQYGAVSEEEDSNVTTCYFLDQDQNIDDGGLFSLLRNNRDGLPGTPNHGEDDNQPAPLGSGALLLVGFGAAYALKKRSKK